MEPKKDAEQVSDQAKSHGNGPLKIGARLAADAYSGSGVLMMKAGRVIEDDRQLSRLLCPDVRFDLHIQPSASEERDPAPTQRSQEQPAIPKSEVERLERALAIKSEAVTCVRSVFDRVQTAGEIDIPVVRSTVSNILNELVSDRLAIASLIQLKDADSYTYTHSVNVCTLAMFLALTSQYEGDVEHIGLGGLLHDVGKLTIPASVLQKQGPLSNSERELVQQHPAQGLDLLARSGCKDPIVLACVLDHHEKMTGLGYPRHKPACAISPYAKIVSLADVFDALTTDRPYRKAMSPRDALLLMVKQMRPEFDPWLLQRFVDTVGLIADHAQKTARGTAPLLRDESRKGFDIDLGEEIPGFRMSA